MNSAFVTFLICVVPACLAQPYDITCADLYNQTPLHDSDVISLTEAEDTNIPFDHVGLELKLSLTVVIWKSVRFHPVSDFSYDQPMLEMERSWDPLVVIMPQFQFYSFDVVLWEKRFLSFIKQAKYIITDSDTCFKAGFKYVITWESDGIAPGKEGSD